MGVFGKATNQGSRILECFVFCLSLFIALSSEILYVVKRLSELKMLDPETGPLIVPYSESGCDLIEDYKFDLLPAVSKIKQLHTIESLVWPMEPWSG